MIKIRLVKKSELEEFTKLRFQSHQYSAKFDKEAVISRNTRAELAKLVKKEFEDPRVKYLLAREDGKPVGIAILSLSEEIDRSAFLGELFVKEGFRGRGIGSQLVKEVIKIAQKRGLRSLRVTVARKNKLSQKFYSRLKFHPQKREHVLLEKNL